MTLFSKFSRAAAVAAILTATLATDTAHAQQSYPMTCRGGGTLSIRNDGGNGVRIRFQPGDGAATQGLSPGQCTWSDRALRPGEPTTICDNSASAAKYVSLLVQSNQYAIVQVYNDGQGCMQVTRVGP
ncbi:hypothetical protein NIES592_23190 [Fischerella major NIES-592]|uniref:Secreted protein n=2 Tax=Fischerella TaxID=1190 RepID=A0A1U7GSZ7_9CYAN|nr:MULTISPECIES: hypothetical protein [Fischerella]OKH10987.1 hypothetical protein NIES592_23190 [Fischerella major NIES-592]PMB42573.1 hypothetical protein CEN41_14870 [Fischerella thermalis CCMEE 5330]